MPVDPQLQPILDQLAGLEFPELSSVPAPVLRQMFQAMPQRAEPPAVHHVENTAFPGPAGDVPIRLYKPSDHPNLPVLVYYHGGGFVVCDLDTHDATCRELANRADCAVVSVDYRLAPEATFPAAPDDCYAAACWVANHAGKFGGDASRIAVGGDSAGGNLAAVTALRARDENGPALRHQLLIYPVTNFDFDTPSYHANAEGYLLTREMMQWFWGHYLADDADGAKPHASPLRAADLRGLPPATVITAEFDPLLDEGEAYAKRLQDAGVATELTRYDGMIHGFFGMTNADRARDAVAQAAAALRQAFRGA